MAERLRIALLIDSSRSYRRGLLRGIAAYARAYGPWSFCHHETVLGDSLPPQLRDWGGDGIIARTRDPRLIVELKRLNLPMVGKFGSREDCDVPMIDSDQRAVVRLAVDHLQERGFRSFAYFGFDDAKFTEKHCQYFLEYVAELGGRARVYEGPPPKQVAEISSADEIQEREGAIARWIRSLPRPVGLMAYNDRCAYQVLTACGSQGIAVPDEVAVIGVDNDEVLCELSDPPLSSVDPNAQRIGYETATLLHRLIRGDPPQEGSVLVQPLGVVARESTDAVAIDDYQTAVAVRYIRRYACDGLQIKELLQNINISRSTLERRFAKYLGRSPRAEIARVQLRRVKELLTSTEFSLEKIAELAGFNYVESMCYLFKRSTGQTPGEYRESVNA